MAYPCQRVRVGGVVSGSTITGGQNLETFGYGFEVWGGSLASPPPVGADPRVLYLDGRPKGRRYWDGKQIVLSLIVLYVDPATGNILTSRGEHLEGNTDTLLGLLVTDAPVVIERDQADGSTRFIEGWVAAAFPVGQEKDVRSLVVPVDCVTPWWQGKTEHSTTITGSGNITTLGNAPNVSNPIINFPGDGLLTHTTSGDTVQVTGSTGAVTVDVGRRTVMMGGNPAANVLRVSSGHWLRMVKGLNTFTEVGANPTIKYRDQWV